jgi:hypothetical protein
MFAPEKVGLIFFRHEMAGQFFKSQKVNSLINYFIEVARSIPT